MNKYYTYDNMDLWSMDSWKGRISPMVDLADFMAERELYRCIPARRAAEDVTKVMTGDEYSKRLNAWLPATMFSEWESKGSCLAVNHAGEHWMALMPKCVFDGSDMSPKTLLLVCETDISNPFWAVDMIDYYRDRFEMAAKEQSLLVLVAMCQSDRTELAVTILREITQKYNIRHNRIYIDVENLYVSGQVIEDVIGFTEKYASEGDQPVVETFFKAGIRSINITGKWGSKNSLQLANFYNGGRVHVPLDFDRLIYGHIGKRCADAVSLEYNFDRDDDPGVKRHLDAMGITAQYRETRERGWVTVVPKCALDNPDKPLPCMCIMQEINPSDRHTVLSAYAMWYEYLEICAQGDLMLLFFVLERADDNDLLINLIDEAKKIYPFIDKSAIYITGHSHNGGFAEEFYRRHPNLLAGAAIMGQNHGYGPGYGFAVPNLTEEDFDNMAKIDMPLISINGTWENRFIKVCPGIEYSDEEKVHSWQNRLRISNCPAKTTTEILEAAKSTDKATAMLGVPADYSETLYFEGDECYLGDIYNNAGKSHLRVITIDNMPHGTTAHMPWLSWSFLRRFKRNPENGEIEELL